MHRGDQDEVGPEGQAAHGAADHDDPILQPLAQHFERRLAELGELVEEQHVAVGAGDLASYPVTLPVTAIWYNIQERSTFVRGWKEHCYVWTLRLCARHELR